MGIFTFFDSGLLAMGNILFLVGVTLLIGPHKTLGYFTRPGKRRGSLFFSIGIFLIFIKHAFFGFAIELFGILLLFGDVVGMIVTFLRSMPVIGPILSSPRVAPYIDSVANINILPV